MNISNGSFSSDDQYPLLTIGILTFDRKELLVDTIKSVLSESIYTKSSRCEIIVANDNPQRFVDDQYLGIQSNGSLCYLNNELNLLSKFFLCSTIPTL